MASKGRTLLKGLGLGAGAMFLFDPRYGRSRRARLRDKFIHYVHVARCALDKGGRDLVNRLHGLASRIRLGRRAPVDDVVLTDRIRSKLGMVTSHPRSIRVDVQEGHVLLSGPILAREVDRVLERLATIPGIRGISNRFQVYSRPGDVPGLQGKSHRRRGEQSELTPRLWSPATRLIAGTGGAALVLSGLMRKGLRGRLCEVAGAVLLSRAIVSGRGVVRQEDLGCAHSDGLLSR